jgi:archaellum component FlaC
MFSIFKKKSEIEKLQDQYAALMKESHALSQKDRAAGDKKFAEAEEIAKQIEKLKLAAS